MLLQERDLKNHVLEDKGQCWAAYLQDIVSALCVWLGYHVLLIETTGPQQRRIQQVSPIGGSYEDYPKIWREAVHFSQQLIQCLLPLFVCFFSCSNNFPSAHVKGKKDGDSTQT